MYWDDRRWLKFFVSILFVLVTFQSVAYVYWLYIFLINHFGDSTYLLRLTWECALSAIIISIVGASVQLFYARRIWVLTRNFIVVFLIVVTSITGSAFAIASSFVVLPLIVIVWLAAAAATDLLITSTLVWYLRRFKTGISSTDHIIDRMIRLSMQTGLPTTICAIFDLATFVAFGPNTHLIFSAPLIVLYTCSLMANLNARKDWKFDGATVVSAEMKVSLPRGETESQDGRSSRANGTNESQPKSSAKLGIGSILFASPEVLSCTEEV
ncbi:hypothetical protein J3A83DRAFT_4211780 [Scleroderma citrinum]